MTGSSMFRIRPRFHDRFRQAVSSGFVVALISGLIAGSAARSQTHAADPQPSQVAAERCEAKIERLELFASSAGAEKTQETRLDEVELNSYLELVLRPQYHPSLQSIRLNFLDGKLQCAARINLDLVEMSGTQPWSGLFRLMLSGIHDLTVMGRLDAKEGKAIFALEEARFDGITLPNLLVSEIISAVGRKQTPPIDPMQPSEMPYRIRRVDIRIEHILIYQ